MSTLGFQDKGRVAARGGKLTADMLYRGPPNPQLNAMMEDAKRRREAALAAQAAGMPMPTQPAPTQPAIASNAGVRSVSRPGMVRPTVSPGPATATGTTQRAPVKAAPVGIEAKIAEALSSAGAAQKELAALDAKLTARVDGAELSTAATTGRLADVTKQLEELMQAAQDAWLSTFWMYADVVVPVVALYNNLPPQRTYNAQVEVRDIVLLVGGMVATSEGPAMRMRSVDATTGQHTEYWVLLANAEGQPFLANFRLTPTRQ